MINKKIYNQYRALKWRIKPKPSILELPNLNESQYWPLEELIEFQNKRLRKIVQYAYNNIYAYRKKMKKAAIRPSKVFDITDLKDMTITERQEMQNDSDFVNYSLIDRTHFTGGSTGDPLEYYNSFLSSQMSKSIHLRGWEWNGYVKGKRLAVVASAQGTVNLPNTINLIGDLSDENMKTNVNELIKFKPQHIRGYVGSLYLLAKFCIDNGITLHGIESVNPISENLYDYQKDTMKKAFNCEIFEEYVCNDGGASAWECERHTALHYNMERAIIEDIDGEMVVTDLWNLAMPFIRYRNGDKVKFLHKKCPCGRNLPLMTVKGRDNDYIISPSKVISPSFLIHHGSGKVGVDRSDIAHKKGIRAVQYIQKKDYVLQISIIQNPWCTDTELLDFKNRISSIIPDMNISIHLVDNFMTTKKGKLAFIINEDKELLANHQLYD